MAVPQDPNIWNWDRLERLRQTYSVFVYFSSVNVLFWATVSYWEVGHAFIQSSRDAPDPQTDHTLSTNQNHKSCSLYPPWAFVQVPVLLLSLLCEVGRLVCRNFRPCLCFSSLQIALSPVCGGSNVPDESTCSCCAYLWKCRAGNFHCLRRSSLKVCMT